MQASRTDWRRQLDFSATRTASVSMANAIEELLRRRKDAQRERQIAAWFRATPKQFISTTLGDMLAAGRIQAGRTSLSRNRCVLEYYLPEAE